MGGVSYGVKYVFITKGNWLLEETCGSDKRPTTYCSMTTTGLSLVGQARTGR